jgi:hypothetical protein
VTKSRSDPFVGICKATKKRQYTASDIAADMAALLMAKQPHKRKLRVYRCDDCKLFHIGHGRDIDSGRPIENPRFPTAPEGTMSVLQARRYYFLAPIFQTARAMLESLNRVVGETPDERRAVVSDSTFDVDVPLTDGRFAQVRFCTGHNSVIGVVDISPEPHPLVYPPPKPQKFRPHCAWPSDHAIRVAASMAELEPLIMPGDAIVRFGLPFATDQALTDHCIEVMTLDDKENQRHQKVGKYSNNYGEFDLRLPDGRLLRYVYYARKRRVVGVIGVYADGEQVPAPRWPLRAKEKNNPASRVD